MASEEDWCAEQLSKLLQEDLRISTLGEIKDHLSSLAPSEATRIATLLDLPLVFDCLNDSNTEQIDLACEVLSLCFNSLNLGESTTRYDAPLERALCHPHPAVKTMALTEIERNISRDEALVDLCKRTSLLTNIIRCIGDGDIAVGKKALDIVSLIGISNFGIKTLVSAHIIAVIRSVMDLNEVVRLRIYELALNIAKESEENIATIKSTGLLNQMLDEIDSKDVLLRMNIVEILSQFGSCKHGVAFLEENKILGKLFSIIENEDDPISCQLCEPGILKFFASVAYWKPLEMFSKYPTIFDRIFANLETSNLIVVSVSLDTLGIIGSSNEGKITLHSAGNKMTYAVKTIARLLSSLPTEVRLRALNCLEHLLRVKEKTNDVMQITRKWYALFGEDPMDIILRYAKNPFAEIKIAGLGILQAMAEQQWGQEEIRNVPGLIEYLLNRNIEVLKECKEMKYEVVKALATSTTLDQSTLNKLQAFVKEGPFYVEAVTEIAFEGDD